MLFECAPSTMRFEWYDKAEIARRFKALRRHASLTQHYLAGLIGVCRQAILDIENMRTFPRYRTWSRFAILEGNTWPRPGAPHQRPLGIVFLQPSQKGDIKATRSTVFSL